MQGTWDEHGFTGAASRGTVAPALPPVAARPIGQRSMLGRNVPHDDRAKDEHHSIDQDPLRNHVASSSDPYDP